MYGKLVLAKTRPGKLRLKLVYHAKRLPGRLIKVCGSGLKTVGLAAGLIQSGYGEVIVAGGMENMIVAPYVLDKVRWG